jgi:hypothetical protein
MTPRESYQRLLPERGSAEAKTRQPDITNKQPAIGSRRSRGISRSVVMFCMGIAATLAWQSYGDMAKELIANCVPPLGWLAPQAVAQVRGAPEMVAPSAASFDSPGLEQLKAISFGLAALRQSVDQLTAQFAGTQQQMANDIAKLQSAEREILLKIGSAASPRSPAAAAAKLAPPAPRSSSTPPVR